MSILFECFYDRICLYFNKPAVPDAVASQGKLSTWEVPQKVTGLPAIGVSAADREGYDQMREQWLYALLGKSSVFIP